MLSDCLYLLALNAQANVFFKAITFVFLNLHTVCFKIDQLNHHSTIFELVMTLSFMLLQKVDPEGRPTASAHPGWSKTSVQS